MTLEMLLFFLLAAVAIAAALGMLLSRNAVYSALYLIVNFATVAVFYLLLGAPFLAMAQVTV
jgi:NADH-quinone oxidoreductase subunit J